MKTHFYLLLLLILTGCSTAQLPADYTGYTSWRKIMQNPLFFYSRVGIERDEEYQICDWMREYYKSGKLIRREQVTTSYWIHCPYPTVDNIRYSTEYDTQDTEK